VRQTPQQLTFTRICLASGVGALRSIRRNGSLAIGPG
jgi:hypothetical protein